MAQIDQGWIFGLRKGRPLHMAKQESIYTYLAISSAFPGAGF